jgi:hypothetical protein
MATARPAASITTLAQHDPPVDNVVTVFDQPATGAAAKAADTDAACVMVSVQVLLLALLQAPPQDWNTCPAAGVAVSVMFVFANTLALHALPQLMLPTVEVTAPPPVTLTDTV